MFGQLRLNGKVLFWERSSRPTHLPLDPVDAELAAAPTAPEAVVGVARVYLQVPRAVAVRAGDFDGAGDAALLVICVAGSYLRSLSPQFFFECCEDPDLL